MVNDAVLCRSGEQQDQQLYPCRRSVVFQLDGSMSASMRSELRRSRRKSAAFVLLLMLSVADTASSAWLNLIASKTPDPITIPSTPPIVSKGPVRIRKTQASDIPEIVQILSTASVAAAKSDPATSTSFNWKSKMNQLWAKADLESLLSVRLEAIEEGQKVLTRYQPLLKSPEVTEADRLRVLWNTDRFRTRVVRASKETGEDNLWRTHNMALPPPTGSWLQHLQMTAEHVPSGEVVGFCEVAMLSNPLQSSFSPAITNLATASSWRRQGIATRLLQSAARFVRQEWQADALGLFVEKDNEAALSLYESVDFETTITCDGGEQLGEMWYMTRDLASDGAVRVREAEFARVR